jgi:hypothetical protein
MDHNKRVRNYSSIINLVIAVIFAVVLVYTLVQPRKVPKQAQEYFREVSFNTIGGRSADSAWDAVRTSDGGYAISGDTRSFGEGGTDIYLVKTDANGVLQWTRAFGGIKDDHGLSIDNSWNHGYIIAGFTNSFGEPGSDMYLMEINAQGEKLWENTVGGGAFCAAYSIKKTSDSNYITAGYTSEGEHTFAWLVKVNKKGEKIWDKTFGGKGWNIFYSVLPLKTGGYLATGYTSLTNGAKSSVYLVKTRADGKTVWERTFGGIRENRGYYAIQTDDGGYLITAKTTSFISKGVGWDIYIIKTDGNGREQWHRFITAADIDVGKTIAPVKDGYIITGTKKCYGMCDSNVVAEKIDADGNTLWFRIFAGPKDDYANTVLTDDKGESFICGSTLSGGNGMSDVMIMKIGADGEKIW